MGKGKFSFRAIYFWLWKGKNALFLFNILTNEWVCDKIYPKAMTEREPKEYFQRAAGGARRQYGVGFLWLPSRQGERFFAIALHAGTALEVRSFFELGEGRFGAN